MKQSKIAPIAGIEKSAPHHEIERVGTLVFILLQFEAHQMYV